MTQEELLELANFNAIPLHTYVDALTTQATKLVNRMSLKHGLSTSDPNVDKAAWNTVITQELFDMRQILAGFAGLVLTAAEQQPDGAKKDAG